MPVPRAALRVLLIVHNRSDIGAFPKILELAGAIAAAGAQVTLLCTARTGRWRLTSRVANSVRIVEAPDLLAGRLRQGVDAWNTLRRLWFLRDQHFDVVHAIDCRPAVIFPALRAQRRGSALVISWWDMFGRGGTALERSGRVYARTLGHVETFFEEHFRGRADRATVVTNFLAERLAWLGYPPERTQVQRVGTDVSRFPMTSKRDARAILGLPADRTVLCHVGSLFPVDRRLLTESFDWARQRLDRPPLLIMVGGNHPATADPDAQHVGRQSDERLWQFVCASDLCLLPMHESLANLARWPSKVGDYFSAGRPVVATRVSDFAGLFPAHGLGFLATGDSAEAYGAAILHAIESRDAWDTIGASCRRFAEAHLDVGRIARQLLALYADAIRDRSGALPA